MSLKDLDGIADRMDAACLEAVREAGEKAIVDLVDRVEYLAKKIEYGDLQDGEMQSLFDDAKKHGEKTAYFVAYYMQAGIEGLEIILNAAEQDDAVAKKVLEESKASSKPVISFAQSAENLKLSADILGDQTNPKTQDLISEFLIAAVSAKPDDTPTMANYMSIYKKVFGRKP